MKHQSSFDFHLRETGIVFLAIFAIISGLPDGNFKRRCELTAGFYCAVRVLLAMLILFPEEVSANATSNSSL